MVNLNDPELLKAHAVKRVLAIDPSINSLGWSYFAVECNREPGSGKLFVQVPKLIDYGTVVMPDKCKQWLLEHRILGVVASLELMLLQLKHGPPYHYVVIEEPEMWGAYKSVASAHSSSLLGLHITVGALLYWGKTVGLEAHLIKVSKWKGQLPKKITMVRMQKEYNVTFDTNDESDAVGLGDWFCTKGIINYEGAIK